MVIESMVPVILEGCIELFSIVSKRVKMPRQLPVHVSG